MKVMAEIITQEIEESFLSKICKDYMLSVHHTCFEKFDYKSELCDITGIIYLDFSRKLVQKNNIIVTDELDKFVWTTLYILTQSHPSLNDTVDFWKPTAKFLWKAEQSNSNDKLQKENLIDYICQLTIECKYVSSWYMRE